jgi:HSP20 family molecular chaperone IbpA
MLLPIIFRDNILEYFIYDKFPVADRMPMKTMPSIMKTDIKETEDQYVLAIDLPGFNKEDVKIHLKDGYLNVSASAQNEEEEKDGKYLRRERYTGAMTRSFYVGKDLTEEDVKAKFGNGVLTLSLPKEAPKKIEEPKYISIE